MHAMASIAPAAPACICVIDFVEEMCHTCIPLSARLKLSVSDTHWETNRGTDAR